MLYLRDVSLVDSKADDRTKGKAAATVDHGVPAEAVFGAEGSTYALETLRS